MISSAPIAFDPLRARVPIDDVSRRIEHENRVIGNGFDEQAEAALGFLQFL